jgi:hypothetical protein
MCACIYVHVYVYVCVYVDLFLSMQQAAGSTAPKMERLEVYKNEANREKYMQ